MFHTRTGAMCVPNNYCRFPYVLMFLFLSYSRIRDHVCMLLRRYPHMDMDVLQKKYPEVNVRALRHHKRSLGHHEHNVA